MAGVVGGEGGLHQPALGAARVERGAAPAQDVGRQEERVIVAVLRLQPFQFLDEGVLALNEVVGRQRLGLPDGEGGAAELVALEVVLDQLARGGRAEVGARREELVGERLGLQPGERGQRLGGGAVAVGRRRGGEEEGVGDDRRQEQPGDRALRLQPGGPVVLGDDRGGAADRLEHEEDRLGGAQVAEVVMVQHRQQFGLLQPVHRLAAVVVIDQDHPLAAAAQQIGAREDAPDVPVVVDDRQGARAGAEQRPGHVGGEVVGVDRRPRLAHDLRDRQAQVQQAGGGVGVVGRADHRGIARGRQRADRVGHRPPADHDQAGRARPQRRLLRVLPVADDHQVAGRDQRLQRRRLHRGDPNAPGEVAIGRPGQQLAAEDAQVVGERDRHAAGPRDRHLVHVAAGQVVHRQQALQPPLLVHDRQQALARLAHQAPRLVEGGVVAHGDDRRVHHVGHAPAHVGQQGRRLHPAALQREGGLGPERPEPRRRRPRQIGRAAERGVGDRRADAVGVGVLVPHHPHRAGVGAEGRVRATCARVRHGCSALPDAR